MINRGVILGAIMVMGMAACNDANNAAGSISITDTAFLSFKSQYSYVSLPLSYNSCGGQPMNLQHVDRVRYRKFISEDAGLLSYCSFKANGNYIALITMAEADCLLPVLTTYTMEGQKIDEKEIAIGGCGSDCDFTCSEYMTVNSDYTIYASDTIIYRMCDSLNEPIPATRQHYVLYKTGKLLTTGKIELTKEIKLMLED